MEALQVFGSGKILDKGYADSRICRICRIFGEVIELFVAALGLDVGRRRIGVAGCDRTGLIAHGITTIMRKSWEQDMAELQQLVKEREVDTLVVGLPYNMDGSIGYQAKQVQKFAYGAAKHLELALEFMDERLTSFEAEQMMMNSGISPRDNKAMIDRKAAALILQQWLEAKRHKL